MNLSRALFFALLAQGSLVLGGALTHIFIGRALGAEYYGTFSMLNTLVFMSTVVFSLGLDQAIYAEVRDAAGHRPQIAGILATGLVGSLITAFSGGGFSIFALSILLPHEGDFNLWVALWVTSSIVLKYTIESMRVLDRVDLGSFIGSPQKGGVLTYGASAFVAALAAIKSASVPKAVLLEQVVILMALATMIVAFISLGTLFVLVPHHLGFRMKLYVNSRELASLIKRGALLSFANFASALRRQLDIILVWLALGPSATGIYSSALRLAALAYAPIAIMNLALPGKLIRALSPRKGGKMADLARHKIEADIKPVVRLSVFVVGITLALFTFLGGEILSLLFGAEYKSGKWILVILTIGQLINVAFGPAVVVLTVLKQDQVLLLATVVGFLFQAVAGYVGARYLGYYWVATTAGLSLFIQNVILAIGLCRQSLSVSIWESRLFGCKNGVHQ